MGLEQSLHDEQVRDFVAIIGEFGPLHYDLCVRLAELICSESNGKTFIKKLTRRNEIYFNKQRELICTNAYEMKKGIYIDNMTLAFAAILQRYADRIDAKCMLRQRYPAQIYFFFNIIDEAGGYEAREYLVICADETDIPLANMRMETDGANNEDLRFIVVLRNAEQLRFYRYVAGRTYLALAKDAEAPVPEFNFYKMEDAYELFK